MADIELIIENAQYGNSLRAWRHTHAGKRLTSDGEVGTERAPAVCSPAWSHASAYQGRVSSTGPRPWSRNPGGGFHSDVRNGIHLGDSVLHAVGLGAGALLGTLSTNQNAGPRTAPREAWRQSLVCSFSLECFRWRPKAVSFGLVAAANVHASRLAATHSVAKTFFCENYRNIMVDCITTS